MIDLNPQQILSLVNTGGMAGLTILLFYGLMKRWIVPGWYYDDLKADRDGWKAKAENTQQERQAFTEWVLRVVDGQKAGKR